MTTTFGSLGDTSAALTASGFYRWFNLTPTTEAGAPGETLYRPSGEAFRPLVALVAEAGADGQMLALELHVMRSFLQDRRQGAFARDIVKSFCQAVAPPSPEMDALADEIMFRDVPSLMIVRDTPALDPNPSPLFLVLAGRAHNGKSVQGPIELSFLNADAPDQLIVRAAPLPQRPAKWFGLFRKRS